MPNKTKTPAKKKIGRPPLPAAEKKRRAEAKEDRQAKNRARALERSAELSFFRQNIGRIPDCQNPQRREKALASFKVFCETYFKKIFWLEWSPNHIRIISKLEHCTIVGENQALAMPRGSGKTMLCIALILWAILTGRHAFALFIAATVPKAEEGLDLLKSVLSNRTGQYDELMNDFPEVCYPLVRLGGEPRKASGQKYETENGEVRATNCKWTPRKLVLPSIEGSSLSGFCIGIGSLDSTVRGGFVELSDGTIARPSLAICDDPQTDESASSQGPGSQTEKRLHRITVSIKGLAGHGRRMTILVPCTVIEQGDLSDQLLNRKKFPSYHGERTKRLVSPPKNSELWEEYRELRQVALENDLPLESVIDFYRQRMATCGRRYDAPAQCDTCKRAAKCMDCGAVIDWQERLDNNPDEAGAILQTHNLTAVQATMHALYEYGPAGFAAEMQNEPLVSDRMAGLPTAIEICERADGHKRGQVPSRARHLTAFIDVGDGYLAYLVAAWQLDFTGTVIDYGTWPDQGRTFSKSNIRHPLIDQYPRSGVDGAIVSGIRDLAGNLLNRQFPQIDAPPAQIGLCLVDTGYKPEAVYSAMRMLSRGPVLRPSRGRGITAGKTQFDDYRRDRCREMGLHWWIPKESAQAVIQIDTNYWKTFVHSRIGTAIGDPGALTLYGKPNDHSLLAEHILAEYYTMPSTEKGVQIQEWHQHVGKDNEWFDCLVGSAVAASKLGCSILPMARNKKTRTRRPMATIVNSSFTPELG